MTTRIIVELCDACERKAVEQWGKQERLLRAGQRALMVVDTNPERRAELQNALEAAKRIGEAQADDLIKQHMRISWLEQQIAKASALLAHGQALQAHKLLLALLEEPPSDKIENLDKLPKRKGKRVKQ